MVLEVGALELDLLWRPNSLHFPLAKPFFANVSTCFSLQVGCVDLGRRMTWWSHLGHDLEKH